MTNVTLPDGETVPKLGIGTWRMGEDARKHRADVEALKHALDLGLTLVDTAEMYADGGAEKVVADAIEGRRKETFIVSKVHPRNAARRDTLAACEASLKRLKTDVIDLYLLHWRSSVPLGETVEAFQQLRKAGKIRHWGVSNFDVSDIAELALTGDFSCATNQVMYHLGARGIEVDLLPMSQKAGMPIMAYSPLATGDILANETVMEIANSRAVSPATIVLAWVLRQDQIIAIPKTGKKDRVDAFAAARDFSLNIYELQGLDRAFPAPKKKTPLAMT